MVAKSLPGRLFPTGPKLPISCPWATFSPGRKPWCLELWHGVAVTSGGPGMAADVGHAESTPSPPSHPLGSVRALEASTVADAGCPVAIFDQSQMPALWYMGPMPVHMGGCQPRHACGPATVFLRPTSGSEMGGQRL